MLDEQQELDRVLRHVERTWQESREHAQLAQELEHAISRILILGSGAGIAVVVGLLGASELEPRWSYLAACVGLFTVSAASALAGLYFRVQAFSDLAVKEGAFALNLQSAVIQTRTLFWAGQLNEETRPKDPEKYTVSQWRFNMWEATTALACICFIGGLVAGVVSVWPVSP